MSEELSLPRRARLARRLLKWLLFPMLVLAVLVRFTIPPSTWWIDGVFIVLCVFIVILLDIGRIRIGKQNSQGSK